MRKNKKKKYAVYFTTDENYWKHSFVAILSLFKFNKFLDVYLLYSNLSSKNVKFFKQFFGKKLTLIKFKKNNLSKIHSYIKGYYLRYFIPDILFKYKKILYLDSDIIVCDNIEKIFNLKIKKTIGAVKEAKSTQNPLFHLKKLTKARFNTGVLLIHTKRYRDKNYLNKILNFSKKNSKEMTDQPVVNVILKNDFKYIDKKWNFLDKFENEEKNRIKILHFNNFKPWKINHKSPHKSLYRKYRRKIDKLFFYDDLSIKNILQKIISY